jgi:hypothetical protein
MRPDPNKQGDLTMRLSDAGLRQRQTEALYINHRPPPWLNEIAAPRSLEPIVRSHAVLSQDSSKETAQ